jgi:hypothetical protein
MPTGYLKRAVELAPSVYAAELSFPAMGRTSHGVTAWSAASSATVAGVGKPFMPSLSPHSSTAL